MRAIDLEARVLTAVEQIRSGKSVEHDFVECKRDWPKEEKVRQLAGSLNRAGGDPVIYIIGIDESSGEIFDVSATEVADWWSQIMPKFDQTPPEMIRHLPIHVGDDGSQVIAVAFASDRAPYVVKTGQQSPNLEVPMREGTRTRTARRDELLRLLIPTVRVPHAVVLEAGLTVEDHLALPGGVNPVTGSVIRERARELFSFGSLRIYVEHDGKDLVTFPAYSMRGRVIAEGESFPLKVRQSRKATSLQGSRDLTAVAPNYDGVSISGPGAVSLDVQVQIDPDDALWFETAQTVAFEIELDVLHAFKPLRVEASLRRNEDATDTYSTGNKYELLLGQWSFNHPGRWVHA
ncbi:hypothetical protein [Arthrobacter sp. NPDC057013]|uniref:hypothetical protein n=1 Tax=Arthrobacter sp. NPDC057013 TaxID=3345999 RepID=UPI00362A78B4